MSRLQVVQAERLSRWSGRWRGTPQRRAILEPLVALLCLDPPPMQPMIASSALAPALWLLDRGQDGIALTQTGAINRAVVREVVGRWPGWSCRDPSRLPYREQDVVLLRELRELLLRLGLVHRTGRRIVTTARGLQLRDDPAALLAALTGELFAGEGIAASCAELASALVLSSTIIEDSTTLTRQIHAAILAENRIDDSHPPTEIDVTWALSDYLRRAEAIGLVELLPGTTSVPNGYLVLTPAGFMALITALRARAYAPATTA